MYRLATIEAATYIHEGHHYRVFAGDIVDLPPGLSAEFMANFVTVEPDDGEARSFTGTEIDQMLTDAPDDDARRILAVELLAVEQAASKPRSTVVTKLSKLAG